MLFNGKLKQENDRLKEELAQLRKQHQDEINQLQELIAEKENHIRHVHLWALIHGQQNNRRAKFGTGACHLRLTAPPASY